MQNNKVCFLVLVPVILLCFAASAPNEKSLTLEWALVYKADKSRVQVPDFTDRQLLLPEGTEWKVLFKPPQSCYCYLFLSGSNGISTLFPNPVSYLDTHYNPGFVYYVPDNSITDENHWQQMNRTTGQLICIFSAARLKVLEGCIKAAEEAECRFLPGDKRNPETQKQLTDSVMRIVKENSSLVEKGTRGAPVVYNGGIRAGSQEVLESYLAQIELPLQQGNDKTECYVKIYDLVCKEGQ